MSDTATTTIDYARLLEANLLIQDSADETYWLCVTRSVQESKLFPVPAYMMYSYINSYYRYPSLLRKVEERMSAEEVGDRARHMASKANSLTIGYAMPSFYLLGRQWLMEMGLLKPTDGLEDLVYVLDFWKRFQMSYHRNDGHLTNNHFGHRSQIRPERTIQVFEADMYDCEQGDDLHQSATAFMATASQYVFLLSCESRIGMHNDGPYRLSDNRQMMIRDFMDLAEGDYPWLDGVAADVPFNTLTIPMVLSGTNVYLTDDFGSFESDPEFQASHVTGVGLYTSDPLTEGYQPVGMGSREELTQTFKELTEKLKDAMDKLWRRIAAWSRDEMIEAGSIVYFSIFKDIAHIAGVYDTADWMQVDERAVKFKALLNDEYSRDVLAELCVGLMSNHTLANQYMMQHSSAPTRLYSAIPYTVLDGESTTLTTGGLRGSTTVLPAKVDRYRTSRGVLTQEDYNAAVRGFLPATHRDGNRFLCETWVKYHYDDPRTHALYELEQNTSRNLHGAGSALLPADIAALRSGAPKPPATHDVVHALLVLKRATPTQVESLLGSPAGSVAPVLEALGPGRVVQIDGSYTLTPVAALGAPSTAARTYARLRGSESFTRQHHAFERVNTELKDAMTRWQTRDVAGQVVPNDHSDAEYDAKVIDQIAAIHERVEPILKEMSTELPRFATYGPRLEAALDKAEDGEVSWISDVSIDSYHTVWFQFHEDLLRVLGEERVE